MKRTILSIFVIILVLTSSTAFIIKSSNGIAGQTGSPGENNCGFCHGGGSSTASGITITATPSFTNNEYVQGQTYTIEITVAAAGFNHYGFGCEILNSNNTNSGTMQNAGSGVKFLTAASRKNAVHTTPRSGSGSANFKFEWVAPSTGETAKIYVGGNCVNFNGSTSGDLTLSTSLALTTPTVAGIHKNNISVSHFNLFPNPVHEIINVSYCLKDESLMTIELISINGQSVAFLLNEKQPAGNYKQAITIPKHITPGVYFVAITADSEKVAQRLIVVN